MKSRTAGFTIIETMIVLAIAGLILLIVFEAIPSLERSGRNNQRKQDVQTLLETVSHYELNDSGNFPLTCGTGESGAGSFSASYNCEQAAGGSYPNDGFLQDPEVASKLTFYDAVNIGLEDQTSATGQYNTTQNQPKLTDPNKVWIYNYEKCDTSTTGAAITTGAGYNDIVALYALETNSGTAQSQCEQL